MAHLVIAWLALCPPSLAVVWRAEGRAEADSDIAANALKWKIYGHLAGLSAYDEVARAKLRERFGVELTAVAQCVVSSEFVARVRGYNERIAEEIDRRYGAAALDRVWEESEQESLQEKVASRWLLKVLAAVSGVCGLWACRRRVLTRRK